MIYIYICLINYYAAVLFSQLYTCILGAVPVKARTTFIFIPKSYLDLIFSGVGVPKCFIRIPLESS